MKRLLSILIMPSLVLAAGQVDVDNAYRQQAQSIVVAPNVLVLAPAAIVSTRDLSDVGIFHVEDSFFTIRDGKVTKVHNYNMDEQLRGMSESDVKSFLEEGYIHLTQSSNGDYNLKSQLRLLGGGLLGGKIAYWITKTLCWAVVGGTAAAGTSYVAGVVAPVVGAKIGLSAATTAKLAIAAKQGASLATAKAGVAGGGAKVLAAVIASDVALAAPATEAVVSYTAAAGGITGLAASIEGISLAVGGFFGFVTPV